MSLKLVLFPDQEQLIMSQMNVAKIIKKIVLVVFLFSGKLHSYNLPVSTW